MNAVRLFFLLPTLLFSGLLFGQEDVNIEFTKDDFKKHLDGSFDDSDEWRSWRHAWRNASDWIEEGDEIMQENPFFWDKALKLYKKAHEVNDQSASLHFRMGRCMLRSNQKFKSLDYFQRAHELDRNVDRRIHFMLGRGYHLKGEWDKAIKAYKQHRTQARQHEELKKDLDLVKKRVEECRNGKELEEDPTRVWIDNLGDSINTEYPEYGAVISPDESLLIFTSRRPNTTGGEKDPMVNMYYEDIYYAERKPDGGWSEAKNYDPPVNTEEHDAIVSLSPDGNEMLIYKGEWNIYSSKKIEGGWSKPEELGDNVNSDHFENSADFSYDGNKLYFVSTRPEGNIGKNTDDVFFARNNPGPASKDIWVTEWNEEDEEWGPAKNLGPTINTPYDEDGIYAHPDGKTIYFSSQGHNSMGGFDIFKSEFNEEDSAWSEPENIGHPVNTPDDDVFFVVGGSGRHAYFTSFREDGFGEKDLYKVTFLGPEKEPVLMSEDRLIASKVNPIQEEVIEPKVNVRQSNLTVLSGKVTDASTGDPLKAKIKLLDNETTERISSTNSDPDKGKYMVSLPAGKNYAIHVEKEDYLFHSENFDIPDTAAYQEVKKNIELQPIEIGKSIVLKNIFYDYDKATLRDESKAELERLIEMLQKHKNIRIQLGGHTDSRGSNAYNKDLSQRRVESVVDYLVEHGIDEDRLEAKGYGESEPIATNDTEEGRQKNRRTEFEVIDK